MARSSSADTEVARRKDAVKSVVILESGKVPDSQPSSSSFVPSAGAVTKDAATNTDVCWSVAPAARSPHQEVIMAAELFRGYDEQAEDAAHLLLNRTLHQFRMPSDGGALIAIMSAKQAQKMVCFLINRALRRIVFTGFTFDLYIICQCLMAAGQRGLDVLSVFDTSHSLRGTTKFMVDCLASLRTSGVKVLLSNGIRGESGGIQHSKTLLCDEYAVIGSCNWTTSSRSNHEIDVLLALNEVGLAAYDERLGFIKETAVPFTDDMERAGREHRKQAAANKEQRFQERLELARQQGGILPKRKPRSTTVPPAERYATAKRFSVARARAQSANRAAMSSGMRPSGPSSMPAAGAAQEPFTPGDVTP